LKTLQANYNLYSKVCVFTGGKMKLKALLICFSLMPSMLCSATARLEVTKDCGISSVPGRRNDNSGASVTVPLRQNQCWSGFETKAYVAAFDTSPVKGWTVKKAWMNLFIARGDLYGVGLCTVQGDWSEGDGLNGQTGKGGASWNWADEPSDTSKAGGANFWTWPGSGIYSASWAHPDARYSHAAPSTLEKQVLDDGRTIHLRFPVDPALVHSLATGLAKGLVLTDDKGQVAENLTLKGTARPYRSDDSQDIYIYTRDIQDKALRPYLEVEGGAADNTAPTKPLNLHVAATDPFEPSVTLSFIAPEEDGTVGGAVLGYDIRYAEKGASETDPEKTKRVPLWAVTKPQNPSSVEKIRLFTIPPGEWSIYLRAIDEAGNLSQPAVIVIEMPEIPEIDFNVKSAKATSSSGKPAVFDRGLKLWACPDMCKVDPVSGGILLDEENYVPAGDYALANEVWNGAKKTVNLKSAKGEIVAFQLLLGRSGGKKLNGIRVAVGDLSGKRGKIQSVDNISTFRVWYLDVIPRKEELAGPWEMIVDKAHQPAWHGDACLPLDPPFESSFNLPTEDNMGEFQNWQSVWVDIAVPQKTRPGVYDGEINITASGLAQPVKANIRLEVLPFSLPDEITWPVELNGYGTSPARFQGINPAKDYEGYLDVERKFHQLAQAHRTTMNFVPYSHNGSVSIGSAPPLKGSGANVKIASWKEWDRRYGPLLSGKAFTPSMGYRGPRQGVPVTEIYLPIHENWPIPLKPNYADWKDLKKRQEFAEWAKTSRVEEAFSDEYKEGFSSVVSQMFRHYKKKDWTKTWFQVYFNNKYYYKIDIFGMRGSGQGVSFWLFDEPVDYDDYDANRFLLQLVKNGYQLAGVPEVRIDYRTDVSQVELTRGLWDNLCNLWNTSGMMDFATTAAFRVKRLSGEKYWRYGGETEISGCLMNYEQNFLTIWALGGAGGMGCWNVTGGGDWFKPAKLSIIYKGVNYARTRKNCGTPLPGVRLKAMRRAQQDMEYLNLLASSKGWSRTKVERAIREYSDNPRTKENLKFWSLSGSRMFSLRDALAKAIMAAAKKK
jgi:hypothetical protein